MNTEIQPLPPFLKSTPRYEEERQRLSDAEACLRAATRHAEMARNGHQQTVWDLLEKQVVVPFGHLVAANDYYKGCADTVAFLSEWEKDAFQGYLMDAKKYGRTQPWALSKSEVLDILRLQSLFPEALTTEPDDLNDNPVIHKEYHDEDRWDYVPVIEAALRDIANRPTA